MFKIMTLVFFSLLLAGCVGEPPQLQAPGTGPSATPTRCPTATKAAQGPTTAAPATPSMGTSISSSGQGGVAGGATITGRQVEIPSVVPGSQRPTPHLSPNDAPGDDTPGPVSPHPTPDLSPNDAPDVSPGSEIPCP